MTTETSPLELQDTILHNDLDLLGDRLIHSDSQERLDYWRAFHSAYSTFPYVKVEHGRILNRYLMCQVAVMMTIAMEIAEGKDVGSIPGNFPVHSLVEWVEDDWKGFTKFITLISQNLLRQDADAPSSSDPNENTHGQRGRSTLYQNKRDKILKYAKVHQALSPFRKDLTEQLDGDKLGDEEQPTVDDALLKTFLDLADDQEDAHVQNALLGLFVDGNRKKPELRKAAEFRLMMHAKPFCFILFYERVNSMLVAWTDDAFETPVLNRVYFPDEIADDEDFTEAAKAVQKLSRVRKALNQTVDDPLEESYALASTIGAKRSSSSTRRSTPDRKRTKAGHLLQRKKTAQRLEFEDSVAAEDEEELSEPGDGVVLSDLPRWSAQVKTKNEESPRKARKSQTKKYQGRRVWSDEEKRAIKEGIRQLGMGNWAEIKKEYSVILELRTSGQIKDCCRTMKRKGELDDLDKK